MHRDHLGQSLLTSLPLTELQANGRVIDVAPGSELSAADIAERLRQGRVRFVVADVGHPLHWIAEQETFVFWKAEVRSRVWPPEQDRVPLEDWPDDYCYRAREWCGAEEGCYIVLEKYH